MNKEALGVIETVGMAAAIQAADTCVKSANVELIGYELSKGSGLVTIKIRGNVGAVKAAIEAAKVSASAINKVYATLIIPRPAEKLEGLIESEDTVGIKVHQEEVKTQEKVVNEQKEESISVVEEIKEESTNTEEDTKEKLEISTNTSEESKDKLEDSTVEEVSGNVEQTEPNSEYIEILEVNEENDKDFQEEDKTSVSDGLVLDNPSSTENLEEEKAINEKDEAEEFIHDDSSLNEQEGDDVCNICHDPACTRKKGQPKTLCINYKGSRR